MKTKIETLWENILDTLDKIWWWITRTIDWFILAMIVVIVCALFVVWNNNHKTYDCTTVTTQTETQTVTETDCR